MRNLLNGRFVAGNDAYVNLTGYTREQLAALPSLIDLAPPEDRQHLTTTLTQRLAGGDVPGRGRPLAHRLRARLC